MSKSYYNLYDFLGYILPGFLLLGGLVFVLQKYFGVPMLGFISSSAVVDSSIFIIFAFIVGHLIQGISNPVEKIIYEKRWGGYPSSKFLDEQDKHFSKEYKEKLRKKLYKQFDLTEESSHQELFNSAYYFLLQKGSKGRFERFLGIHGFYRGLMVACSMMFLLFFVVFIFKVGSVEVFVLSIFSLISAIIFYKRFVRFSVYFADSVYKEFYVLTNKN